MKVMLLAYTENAEKVIASAAKLCYSKTGVEDILEGLTEKKTKDFLEMLMGLGHQSPIEHTSFTFAVEGVSRVLTHQLVRHRIASYSQQSQRYVKLDQFEYIIPPSIAANEEAKAIFIQSMEEDQRAYDRMVEILSESNYKRFIEEGHSEKSARGMSEKSSIEDARYVFPNACETKVIMTMNARSLLHFFEQRCCNRAQWEIRELAEKMAILVKEVAPTLFQFAGPACIHGSCPEGNMSCGKMREMKQKYLTEL